MENSHYSQNVKNGSFLGPKSTLIDPSLNLFLRFPNFRFLCSVNFLETHPKNWMDSYVGFKKSQRDAGFKVFPVLVDTREQIVRSFCTRFLLWDVIEKVSITKHHDLIRMKKEGKSNDFILVIIKFLYFPILLFFPCWPMLENMIEDRSWSARCDQLSK